MEFIRGQDPKSKMGIGISQKLEELIAESIERYKFNLANLEDLLLAEEKRITEELGALVSLKIKSPGQDILDYFLVVTCESIGYEKEFSIQGFSWPTIKNVAAKTMRGDLISVTPMAAPTGNLFYLDYKYKRNWFQRIMDKIKDAFRKKTRS